MNFKCTLRRCTDELLILTRKGSMARDRVCSIQRLGLPTRNSVDPLHRLTAAERRRGLPPPNDASDASMLRFAKPKVIHMAPRAPSLYLSASMMYATWTITPLGAFITHPCLICCRWRLLPTCHAMSCCTCQSEGDHGRTIAPIVMTATASLPPKPTRMTKAGSKTLPILTL